MKILAHTGSISHLSIIFDYLNQMEKSDWSVTGLLFHVLSACCFHVAVDPSVLMSNYKSLGTRLINYDNHVAEK